MRKIIITLLILLCFTAFAKTWEGDLQVCHGVTEGFWFPDHKWTDKGDPWIKPFPYMGKLQDFENSGFEFNFDVLGLCLTCEMLNFLQLNYYPPTRDSIYFFISCLNDSLVYDSLEHKVVKKEFSFENFSINDFALLYSLDNFCYNGDEGIYFIYKKYSDRFEYNALCNMLTGDKSYSIQCEFQDDGTLNFDKLPDFRAVPENFCEMYYQKVLSVRKPLKNFFANQPSYKINGTPASQGSSNIIIKNNQPTLQLKGEH